MLCSVVVCCAVLCCDVLFCCVVLWCVVMCCVPVCHSVPFQKFMSVHEFRSIHETQSKGNAHTDKESAQMDASTLRELDYTDKQ